jgi:hypothetical protein
MKKVIFILTLLACKTIYSQKSEISIFCGRSVNLSNHLFENDPYKHSKLNFSYSNNFTSLYKYKISDLHKIFASAGIDYSTVKHYHNVYLPNSWTAQTLKVHQINSRFASLSLGLHKEFDIIEEKLIFDIHLRSVVNFQSNKILNESFDTVTFTFSNYTQHHYDLTSRPNNNRTISFDCGFDFKFYLKRNFYLNIGARFHSIFNESEYYYQSQSYSLDGEPDEPQFGSYTVDGYKDGIGKVNTILMTPRFGLSYRF